MKANLTRGNSVTDFSDWLEESIYNEIKHEYYKELDRVIKEDLERLQKEFIGEPDSKPVGYYTYPNVIGVNTSDKNYCWFAGMNCFNRGCGMFHENCLLSKPTFRA